MGKNDAKTTLMIGMVIVILFSAYTLLAQNTNNDGASGIIEREGYIKTDEVTSLTKEELFTVPEGEQFVLTKVYLGNQNIYLTVDDETLIHLAYFSKSDNGLTEDFADRCIVIKSGKTLKAVNISGVSLRVTVVGYFCGI